MGTTESNQSEQSPHPSVPMLLMLAGALLLLHPLLSSTPSPDHLTYIALAAGTVSVTIGLVQLVRTLQYDIGLLESAAIGVTGGFIAKPLQDLGHTRVSGIPLILFAVLGLGFAVNSLWESWKDR